MPGRRLESQPQVGVERDLGLERRHLGQGRIVGRPQFRRIGDRCQVRDLGPSLVEQIRGRLEREEGVAIIRRRQRLARDGRNGGFRIGEGVVDGSFDVAGAELRPLDLKRAIQKGIVHRAGNDRPEGKPVKRNGPYQ